ncbi:MAG: iron-sulfur cluster-binding protein [Deltaproteobacteria bacterium]|nr:MAG: iron-sulfur cluster-binding protein [Deltaproteobacteria bacterium]
MKSGGAIPFRENAKRSLRDPDLRRAMRAAVGTFGSKRESAVQSLPGFEEYRERAAETKSKVIENLEEFVNLFREKARERGVVVHDAPDAETARKIVGDLFRERGVRLAVKSKSMVTEEIHLNEHLEKMGIEVLETDLGEYIVQLAKESPSHIIVPAIHRDRKQVAKLFSEKLGVPYTEDVEELTKVARRTLREKFLAADAGISGANFLIAQTGSVAIFTNEGNGRMVTTVPKLHVVVTSVEKVIPSLEDLALFSRLLPRSATGQVMSSYLSLITGPRREGEGTGAEEVHLVLLDNGRRDIARSDYRDILRCIRCGACMNVCPVYRVVGGHAYGSTYPGPMGIVLTSALQGLEKSHPIVDGSTLCGACAEVCPVKIPLVDLILALRREKVRRGLTPALERAGMRAFGKAASVPQIFSAYQQYAHSIWPLAKIFGSPAGKKFPRPERKSFVKRVRDAGED